jgi:hypothetical protein
MACAVTVAPASTAPLGSVTTPVMEPVTAWPKAKDALSSTAHTHPITIRRNFLLMEPRFLSQSIASPSGLRAVLSGKSAWKHINGKLITLSIKMIISIKNMKN